ncbi:hypothetical protein MMC25_003607 [Agyrium rufum]|nr:hypothetical protein [Agyrium rufum]
MTRFRSSIPFISHSSSSSTISSTTSLLLALLLSTVLPSTTTAQSSQQITLLDPTLPSCAQQCAKLSQADKGCTPAGGAPVTDLTTYTSCFCQSALLTSLKTAPTQNICQGTCSETDWATIDQWYVAECPVNGAAVVPTTTWYINGAAGGATTTAPAGGQPTTLQTQTGTSTSSAATSTGTGQGDAQPSSNTGKGWFTSHWRWVVMVIVLFIAFLVIGIVGTILHKRHVRRREAADPRYPPVTTRDGVASRQNTDSWGPTGHSVHDLGYGGSGAGANEKGKSKDTVTALGTGGGNGENVPGSRPMSGMSAMSERSGSRLKKKGALFGR